MPIVSILEQSYNQSDFYYNKESERLNHSGKRGEGLILNVFACQSA